MNYERFFFFFLVRKNWNTLLFLHLKHFIFFNLVSFEPIFKTLHILQINLQIYSPLYSISVKKVIFFKRRSFRLCRFVKIIETDQLRKPFFELSKSFKFEFNLQKWVKNIFFLKEFMILLVGIAVFRKQIIPVNGIIRIFGKNFFSTHFELRLTVWVLRDIWKILSKST